VTPQSTLQRDPKETSGKNSTFTFSLDTWAVALSLAVSLLVWLGLIKHIPW
jgi:hypothetical protein